MMKKITAILVLLFITCSQALSQDMPAIVTDRPDQTESSSVVPVRTLQVETGVLLGSVEGDSLDITNISLPGVLFRYGLLEYLELRFGFNYLFTRIDYKERGFDEQFDGFSPISAGFKIFITEQKKMLPQLSFIGALAFPGTGSNTYDIEYLAANMRLAGSWIITPRFSIGTNLGIEWNGFVPEGIGFYSVVGGFSIYKDLGGFIEFYGYIPERDVSIHELDGGFTYLIRNNLQVDLSAGVGLTPVSPDFFVSSGVSWRIPR